MIEKPPGHGNSPPGADTQPQPHQRIRRGLAWSGWCALAAGIVIVALAFAAVWEAEEARRNTAAESSARTVAEQASFARQEQLWQSQIQEARSYRLEGGVGQRTRTLEVVALAATYRPSVELRNEAIAALVLPDLGSNLWWHAEDNPIRPAWYTSDLVFFVPVNDSGRVSVYRAGTQQVSSPAGDLPHRDTARPNGQQPPTCGIQQQTWNNGKVTAYQIRCERVPFCESPPQRRSEAGDDREILNHP